MGAVGEVQLGNPVGKLSMGKPAREVRTTVKTQTMWVPFSVLNDRSHSMNTRLVWLLLGAKPVGSPSALDHRRLRAWSGLDPKTWAGACARLAQAPLGPCFSNPQPSCAAIPMPLLTDGEVSPGARLLYGQLQGFPGFEHPTGSFTYARLAQLTGRSDDALREATAQLAAHGWLTLSQVNRKAPLSFTLHDPVATRLRARISSVRRKVKGALNRGQTLLGEWLNAVVALDQYQENATPDFLRNPYTGELMEIDRYYPTKAVAIEFNGAQHYDVTDLATYEDTVKQIGRDAMKPSICKVQKVQLVVVHPEDLSLKALEQKIPSCLPRRDLKDLKPLVAALEELGSEYRRRTDDEQTRRSPHRSGRG